MDKVNEFLDCDLQRRVHLHGRLDLFAGVDDSGMVAPAKLCSNLRQRAVCQLPRQVHGNLARKGDVFRALFRFHFRDLDAVVIRDDSLDQVDRNWPVLGRVD